MRIRTFNISIAATDVLLRSSWRDNVLLLPEGQLERSLYQDVDRTIKALGGKWSRLERGHVFPAASAAELQAALDQGSVVDHRKTFEQFFTPADVASKMHAIAEIGSDDTVLEPSAGNGRLIWEALNRGALVTAIEIDPKLCDELQLTVERQGLSGLTIVRGDFMKVPELAITPDVVIMNPPFSAGQDMAHVMRAWDFLAPGGRLVSILSPHWTFANDRRSIDFRIWAQRFHAAWRPLPQGAFQREGTGVSCGILSAVKPR